MTESDDDALRKPRARVQRSKSSSGGAGPSLIFT